MTDLILKSLFSVDDYLKRDENKLDKYNDTYEQTEALNYHKPSITDS